MHNGYPGWAYGLIASAVIIIALQAHAYADGFVPGIEDLPLAPGLTASSETAVVFDTPSGRIVDALAEGIGSIEGVGRFYRETLPQLGWHHHTRYRYSRGSEILELNFQARDVHRLTVKYSLKPAVDKRP